MDGVRFDLRITGTYQCYTVDVRVENLNSGKTNVYKEYGFALASDPEVEAIVGQGHGVYLIKHIKGRELCVLDPAAVALTP
jgi:hypothetical protein